MKFGFANMLRADFQRHMRWLIVLAILAQVSAQKNGTCVGNACDVKVCGPNACFSEPNITQRVLLCSSQNLIELPCDYPDGLTSINFNNNSLQNLDYNVFHSVALRNINTLCACELVAILRVIFVILVPPVFVFAWDGAVFSCEISSR
eukprot:m.48641 g.48641  ORF g.48641 m.48641 type:complete len:148 (-) comp11397_c0_seq2:1391-1834(-)